MWTLYIKSKRFQIANGWKNNRRCHFPYRPSLSTSSGVTGGRTWQLSRPHELGCLWCKEVQFHNCTFTWSHTEGASIKKKSDVYKLNLQASPYTNRILTVNKILVRYVRESHLPKQVLKMGLRKKNMHFCLEHSFSGDPVFPDSKVSAKL